jgi:MFS family permease
VTSRPRLLADRNFLLFMSATLGAEMGGQIVFVAIGWQVFLISHRPFDLGLVGLAMFLPAIVLVFASGVIADRLDRRSIVIVARISEAVCACGYVGLATVHVAQVWPYLAIALGLGAIRALSRPAEKTFLPNIVATEVFVSAQAAYITGRELTVIVGPAVGGALLALAPQVAFGTAAVVAVFSAGSYTLVHIRPMVRSTEKQTWRTALAGLAFLRAQPVVFGAIALDLFAVLFGGATALLPVYADVILQVGPVGLGYLRSAPSVGAAIVAAVLTRRPPQRHVGVLAFVAVIGFGVATIVFAISKVFWLSLLALAVMGAFDIVGGVIRNGLVQLNTPDAMRGRVIAIQSVFTTTSNELGAFESGTLAALIGTVGSVVAGGAIALAVAAACAQAFPALRRADRFVQAERLTKSV